MTTTPDFTCYDCGTGVDNPTIVSLPGPGSLECRVFVCDQCLTLRSGLTTREAARELGIHRSRVLHLISEGRLPAMKQGRDWLIQFSDLETVRDRKSGYPKGKPRKTS